MKYRRPSQITERHLGLLVIIFVRQSSKTQVKNHKGSAAYQRGLANLAREWGWRDELIRIEEGDMGRSGTSARLNRGFRQMLELISGGKVGAIFASDFSRFARNNRDAADLIEECSIHDVLIVSDGIVQEVTKGAAKLTANLLANVAEFENDQRRERFFNARLEHAKKGKTVSTPPVGYVARKRKWLLDPDPMVREAVARVFHVYLEQGSINRALQDFNRTNFRLPRRDGLVVDWIVPTANAISFLLRNRAYVGDYVFRKRRTDKRLGRSANGRWRDRPASPEECVVVADNHKAYVSRQVFDETQRLLDKNSPNKGSTHAGRGRALLQSRIRCGLHNAAMSPKYKSEADGRKYHGYECPGEIWRGGPRCKRVTASRLEPLVIAAVLSRLRPPTIEAVREGWRSAVADELAEQRRYAGELKVLRKRENDLRSRYMQVDPENRLVAGEIEQALEKAKQATAEREAAGPRQPAGVLLSEEDFAELLDLCNDMPALWDAPTTEARDHKDLICAVVKAVIIDEFGEAIRGHIEWNDGSPLESFEVPLTEVKHRLIHEMDVQGLSPADIAERLNALGLQTLKGAPWTRKAVYTVLYWRRRRQAEAAACREEHPTSPLMIDT